MAPVAKFFSIGTLNPLLRASIATSPDYVRISNPSVSNNEEGFRIEVPPRSIMPARGPLRAPPTLFSLISSDTPKISSDTPNTLNIVSTPPPSPYPSFNISQPLFSLAEAVEEQTTSTSTSTVVNTPLIATPPPPLSLGATQIVPEASQDPAAVPAESSTTSSIENTDTAQSPETAISEFRERLRWLNKITADATEELDAIAPPPLKGALDGAVKAAKETDIGPALGVAKRVVGDLQEGFSGLLSSAKDFDAAATTAELKARMEKEIESRKEIPPPPPPASPPSTSSTSSPPPVVEP